MERHGLQLNGVTVAAVIACAAFWALAADGAYRATHDNGHGIRRALQAKAAHAVTRVRRAVDRELG